MNIVFYCQHVLGLGHFMRSLAIVEALAPNRVAFVTGGPSVPARLPGHVAHEPLPEISMDEDFSALQSPEDLERTKALRAARLLEILRRERPDAFVVELYPFGRRAFEFELLPALAAVRDGTCGRPVALCSLRDILVEKADPDKYQTRVIGRLNSLFDGVLLHSDPELFPLEESFPRAAEITVPVAYTGFVTRPPAPDARERVRAALGLAPGQALAVASAGGGKVGSELLFASLRAWPLADFPEGSRLEVFSGPFLDEQAFNRLGADASGVPGASVSRFAAEFPDLLAAADLSVSLAGYNTCMNVLAAGTPALLWPFAQNREQALRAGRLSALGSMAVLSPTDLEPGPLAALMRRVAGQGRRTVPRQALDGAARAARLICEGPWRRQ